MPEILHLSSWKVRRGRRDGGLQLDGAELPKESFVSAGLPVSCAAPLLGDAVGTSRELAYLLKALFPAVCFGLWHLLAGSWETMERLLLAL